MSAIKFRKKLPKFMILIPLLYKFGRYAFMASIEMSQMTRHPSKANKLRDAKKNANGMANSEDPD